VRRLLAIDWVAAVLFGVLPTTLLPVLFALSAAGILFFAMFLRSHIFIVVLASGQPVMRFGTRVHPLRGVV
jgi:hypothetical protein